MTQESLLQLSENPNVSGWGADLDEENRPAVPMKRTPPRFINPHWTQPTQQVSDKKVFHSTERPSITPVFGTPNPPSGISGFIRGVAFKYSENDLRHWLMLLFADRVNILEGIGSDLLKGRLPNPFSEMGLKAEFKYNKRGVAKKAALGLGILALGTLAWKAARKK